MQSTGPKQVRFRDFLVKISEKTAQNLAKVP